MPSAHIYVGWLYTHNKQGVGVGITALRRGAVLASVALRRRLLVTLEINNKDRAYDWFLAWLAHHQRTTRRPAWAHSHQLSVETAYAQHKNGSADVLFRLVAGPGVHWLKYRGAWMQVCLILAPYTSCSTHLLSVVVVVVEKVKRERETRAMQMASGTPWETVTLTTLSRDRALFAPLLAEARDSALRGQEGRLVVHTAWGTEWRPFGLPRRKRPLHSVVLAPGIAEKIIDDVRAFLGRREWYADRGGFFFLFYLREREKRGIRPVDGEVRLCFFLRYSLPQRLFAPWTTWIWKVFVHSGARWIVIV